MLPTLRASRILPEVGGRFAAVTPRLLQEGRAAVPQVPRLLF